MNKLKSLTSKLIYLFKKKMPAFSLIELMISMITIAIISASFTPVISKKIKNGSLSIGGGDLGGVTANCATVVNSSCTLCNVKTKECLACFVKCNTAGQYHHPKKCACSSCTVAPLDANVVSCKYDSSKQKPVPTKCKTGYYINGTVCSQCSAGNY